MFCAGETTRITVRLSLRVGLVGLAAGAGTVKAIIAIMMAMTVLQAQLARCKLSKYRKEQP